MTPTEYIKAAHRTISHEYPFTSTNGLTPDMEHAIIGIADEAGELIKAMKKIKIYNQKPDNTNMIEEAGDIMWYLAIFAKALGVTFEDIWQANINKLKVRYPEQYTDYEAAEENRDRAKEREVLEK